ncbi:MAG: HAD family hydrolase [Cryobacterium sp.]|nr:HAD family hydrolase [Oligoflexia bacterium]
MTAPGKTQRATQIAAIAGFLIALGLQSFATRRATACLKPWVFFDLGNTLVTANPGKPMSYLPGAHEYVRQLKRRGFRIGVISNVPESWGHSSKTKVEKMKKTLMAEWSRDPLEDPMDWTDFSDALIFVPPRENYRKPAPYLFRAALSQVILEEGETRCKVVFQGDDATEVETAKKEGMIGFHVDRTSALPFFPLTDLERIVYH